MAVLDSTFLIDLEEERPRALATFDKLVADAHALRIPAAVWTEYLSAMPPSERATAARTLERSATFVPYDRDLADVAARVQHDLATRGREMAWHDLQVAATALHYGEPVVSNDRAFKRVPGLDVMGH